MMRIPIAALVVFCAAASGCGDDAGETSAPPGHWRIAELAGIAGARAIAPFEDELLVLAGDAGRDVYALAQGELEPGGRMPVRTVSVIVQRDAHISGRGEFALREYQLGDLWDASLDLRGLAVQAPGFVFVGDRTFRVVFWGSVDKDAAGRARRLRLIRAFAAPGALRTGTDAADYRDKGPGLAALLGLHGRRATEDLYLADRAGREPDTFRVLRLDRFGQALGSFIVQGPAGSPADVEALSIEGDRFLVLRGEGRGALAPFRDPARGETVTLGQSVPGPEVRAGTSWRGMCHAADGTLFLVSDGDPAQIAWRAP